MPSHVFSTLGLWQEVIASDLAADANFVAYFRTVDPRFAASPEASRAATTRWTS